MKTLLFICLVAAIGVAGCDTSQSKRVEMGVRMLNRPVELEIKVNKVTQRFDSAPQRFFVEALVLVPETRKGTRLNLVVDGVDSETDAFVQVGSEWLIHCDEQVFEEQAAHGLSFWRIDEMKPRKPEPRE